MKRPARILLDAVTVLSLLLFLATVALWIRGHFAYDVIGYRNEWGSVRLQSSRGGLAVVAMSFSEASPLDEAGWYWQVTQSRTSLWHEGGLGFAFDSVQVGSRYVRGLFVPAWFAALVTGIPPALGLWRRLRKRRSTLNLCPVCGYDLRATPDRCPECGAVASSNANAGERKAAPPPL